MGNVIIGLKYKKTNVTEVDSVAIYNIESDKKSLIKTKKAKDSKLKVVNGDFNFFVNKVNFHIGEQEQYPCIMEFQSPDGKTKQQSIENGIIIYDIKPKDNKYNIVQIVNNQIRAIQATEKELIQIYNLHTYKCNFSVEDGKLKITYKENGVAKEFLTDEERKNSDVKLHNMLQSWYKIDPNTKRMIKQTECPDKTFKIAPGVELVDGFTRNENIEEVDLTGAVQVCIEAFKGCKNLRKVILSNSLKQIGTQAFANCPKLKEITYPASCQKIGVKTFDNGVVNVEVDLSKRRDLVRPFGPNTHIMFNGKEIKIIDTIKVAYKQDDENIYYYEIESKSKAIKKSIKKEKIDFLDIYINYSQDKVLTGDVIICGKIKANYLVLEKETLKEYNFEDLKDKQISDGIIVGQEILPKESSWGWFSIDELSDSLNTTGKQLVEFKSQNKGLEVNERTLMSKYVTLKLKETLGYTGKTICKVANTKKAQDVKDRYPGYIWKLEGYAKYGMKCNNPGKYNEQTGKVEYKNKDGWYYCYFGHPTKYHYIVNGYLNGELMETFTFGEDCASDFAQIDKDILKAYSKFNDIVDGALKEIEVAKNKNSFDESIKKNKKFYEMLYLVIKTNHLDWLGPCGELAKEFLQNKIIIPSVIQRDIYGYIKSKENQSFILDLIIKNKKNLEISYNFPNTKLISLIKDYPNFKETNDIKNYLNSYFEKDIQKDQNIKQLNDIIEQVQIDETFYKEKKAIRNSYDELGLKPGRYILENSILVDTYNCIVRPLFQEGGSYYDHNVCDFNYGVDQRLKDFMSKIDKTKIIPFDNKYSRIHLKLEILNNAQKVEKLLDISNIPENKIRVLIQNKHGFLNSIHAVAYKNNLLISDAICPKFSVIHIIKNGQYDLMSDHGLYHKVDMLKTSLYYYMFFEEYEENYELEYYELDYDHPEKITQTLIKNDLHKKFNNITEKEKILAQQIYKEKYDQLGIKNHELKTYQSNSDFILQKIMKKLNNYVNLDDKQYLTIIISDKSINSKEFKVYYTIQKERYNLKIAKFDKIYNEETRANIYEESDYWSSAFDRKTRARYFTSDFLNQIDNCVYTIVYFDPYYQTGCLKDLFKSEEMESNIIYKNNDTFEDSIIIYCKCNNKIYKNDRIILEKEEKDNITIYKSEDRLEAFSDFINLRHGRKSYTKLKKVEDYDSKSYKKYVQDESKNNTKTKEETNKNEINKNETKPTSVVQSNSKTIKKGVEFIEDLKNNLGNIEKWIGNAQYINAYKNLAQKLIDGKQLVGKQYKIVYYIKKDLGAFLNKKY